MAGSSPGRLAWRRFRRNPLAMGGLVWLLVCTLVGVFAYPLMPDRTQNANFQVIELPKQAPGTAFTLILRPNRGQLPQPGWLGAFFNGRPDNVTPIAVDGRESVQLRADSLLYTDVRGRRQVALLPELLLPLDKYCQEAVAWKAAHGKPYLLEANGDVRYVPIVQDSSGSGAVTSGDASQGKPAIPSRDAANNAAAGSNPIGQPSSPGNDSNSKAGASVMVQGTATASLPELKSQFLNGHIREGHFWMGSDAAGRDVLSRLILGTRVSLGIGLMAVLVSLLVGVTLGAVAGFFRGRVDRIVMWFVSVVWSIPTLLLAISLAYVMGKGTWQLFLAIGISSWVDVARIVRGQIFSIREMQYIEATRALGYRWPRAIFRHVLPNVMSPLIIIAAANFASAILMEAGLSFLGVGVQPPTPSWGSMIREGYTQIMFDSGIWLAIFPGLAIILVVISLNLVGFGLRDALDPKHRS